MNLRKRLWAAVGGVAAMAGSAFAGSPEVSNSHNQKVAQDVALAIGSAVPDRGYEVAVETRDGIVTLRGVASSSSQVQRIVEAAQGSVPSCKVVNELSVNQADSVQVTDYAVPTTMVQEPVNPDAGMQLAPAAPTPQYTAPTGTTPQYDYPHMPPFAWPANAPYPNYSAVQYPRCYPKKAWPFIGPYHPYPEPPLDWRTVKLTWRDGHWFLRFNKPCCGYCRLPIWVGCTDCAWEVAFAPPKIFKRSPR